MREKSCKYNELYGTQFSGPRKIVSPSRPWEEGMYWGYKVRYAANISSVFKNCPYQVLLCFFDHLWFLLRVYCVASTIPVGDFLTELLTP